MQRACHEADNILYPKPAVNLLLRWGWDEGRYHIIIKNIRKFDPPLKPLYEHYLEDDKLVALDLLKKARDSVFKRLLEFAEKDNLLCVDLLQSHCEFRLYRHPNSYFDFHQLNIFFDKSLQTAMPIDWAPPSEHHAGVEEFVGVEEKKSEIQDLKERMLRNLPVHYSIDKLEDVLLIHGKDLRE